MRNVSIQIIRICAMLSIILCHLVQEVNNTVIAYTGQFFNVGVFIFIFLSGYLYGKKKIENNKEWLINRAKKIIIPVYSFMIFLIIIHIVNHTMEYKYIFIYLFDLQYYLGGISGAQHLWFVSVIMLCYIVNIHLQYNNKMIMSKKINIIFIMISIICVYLSPKFGQTLIYIYILGYKYRYMEEKFKFNIFKTIGLMIIAILTRLYFRQILDGSLLYDVIIVSITHTILGICIFRTIKYLCEKFNIKGNKFINSMDNLSYYIYITHYMFMVGPIRTMGMTQFLIINIIITIVLSYISAIVLRLIDNKIQYFIEKINLFKNKRENYN